MSELSAENHENLHLEKQLKDTFKQNYNCLDSSTRSTATLGSILRQELVQRRRSSLSHHSQLWKRAALAGDDPWESSHVGISLPDLCGTETDICNTEMDLSFRSASERKYPSSFFKVLLEREYNKDKCLRDIDYDSCDSDLDNSILENGSLNSSPQARLPTSIDRNEEKYQNIPMRDGIETEDDDTFLKRFYEEVLNESAEPSLPRLMTRRATMNMYKGEGIEIAQEEIFSIYSDQQYNPWESETDIEGRRFDFRIIGTSADDVHAHPHVMTPPLMHALQGHLPFARRGESFWLKYSLVRDGADPGVLLTNVLGCTNTLMAIETVEGEVFGAYTGAPWAIQPNFFGTGETFVWKMKSARNDASGSLYEQALREADIAVFKYSFQNNDTQICQQDRIAIGGGMALEPREICTGEIIEPNTFGFAICFDDGDLLHASSSPCLTFNSPSLVDMHPEGSKFELLNLEVWSFTPCISLEEAELMECQQLLLSQKAWY